MKLPDGAKREMATISLILSVFHCKYTTVWKVYVTELYCKFK